MSVPSSSEEPRRPLPRSEPETALSAPRRPPLAVGIGVAIALLVALGIWASIAMRPQAAKAERRDIVVTVLLRGEVIAPPAARADVRAPFGAPVARVFTSIGARVQAGDSLVELSRPSSQEAYDQARQAVKEAEAELRRARRPYWEAVEAAKREREAARAAEKAAVAAAPAPPEETPGTVIIQEPPAEVAQARRNRLAAEQKLIQAQEAMKAALTPYQQRVAAALAAFAEAQAGRKETLIRAPITGTVLTLNARPGAEVGADAEAPVATIIDLGQLQVHAPMTAEQASSVKPGVPVVMTVRELPGEEFTGAVTRITSDAEGGLRGQRYVAIITFKNRNGLVKPGMNAVVSARVREARGVVAVPSAAVDPDATARPLVRVLRNGQWEQAVVEAGITDGQYTEITAGIREGETVQVTPDLF